MASRPNIIASLDIGTSKIAICVAQVMPDSKLEIIGVGTTPSRGLRKGVVINIEATIESISKAISEAETMAGVEISNVFAGISGGHIKGFNSHGIVGVKNKEVNYLDIEKVIEAAKAVAIPLDREILHVIPQEFVIDEQDGIKEPLGMSGVRLEAKVHIVTGAVASAQNVVKCANRCGLAVADIVLAGLSSAKSVLSAEERELGVCLLDIGAGTTDIIVYHNGAVRHTAVIAVGGSHLTMDIAAGLRTPISSAEDIKCKYGSALAKLVRHDETLEVPSTGGRPPRVLSKLALSEIIEPRIEEILTLTQRELVRSGCDEFLTSGLVLTGGSANLSGIAELAEHIFHLPVRIGKPGDVGGLSEMVKLPEYATVVGLVHYGAEQAVKSKFRGQASGLFGGMVSGMKRRVHSWLNEHL